MTPANEGVVPKLHGDGEADDTDAVQWYLDRNVPLPEAAVGYRVDMARLRVPVGVALASRRSGEPDAAHRTKLVAL